MRIFLLFLYQIPREISSLTLSYWQLWGNMQINANVIPFFVLFTTQTMSRLWDLILKENCCPNGDRLQCQRSCQNWHNLYVCLSKNLEFFCTTLLHNIILNLNKYCTYTVKLLKQAWAELCQAQSSVKLRAQVS